MIEVECLYNGEYRQEWAYTPPEFPWDKLKAIQKGKSKYIELPATLDIESSTIKNEYMSLKEDRDVYQSYMYHWQICVEGFVCFGRTWQSLQEFMARVREEYELTDKRRLVVYVHNLSYEFHFMYNFFEPSKVFATDVHKVLKTRFDDVFEFRCSYRLSNMNLAKFIENSENCPHGKGTGDLDHRQTYTSETIFKPRQNGYMYNDVLGLYEAVCSLLVDDTLDTIPMTSTGYVRRDCRNAMRKNRANRIKFQKSRLYENTYQLLQDCFRGGNTAGSRYLTNQILEGVSSWDLASSYPYVMVSEKFPVGEFMSMTIDSLNDLESYNKKYATMGRYIFTKLKLKDDVPIPYLPFSKCQIAEGSHNYNGRILKADLVETALTNIDFDILQRQYTWEELYVKDFYFSRTDYLPKELRDQIIKYFHGKTTLKGLEEFAYEYLKSKGRINAIYGMTVTDILHELIIFNAENEFKEDDEPKDTAEALDKYYSSRNNFLSYQWGVWVTAYSRTNLQKAIDLIGLDVVYTDTDSVKYIGDYDWIFEQLNKDVIERCKKAHIVHSVEHEGEQVYMGVWDREHPYDRFITMGAKKYAFEQNGKIGVTVAGLNKEQGAEELTRKGGLERFTMGEVFHNSGRTVAQYHNMPIHTIEVDGVEMVTASNIAIVDTTYTLGITGTMLEVLELYNDTPVK